MANKHDYIVPIRMLFIMWLVFTVEFYSNYDLGFLGILPRKYTGLVGVIFAPLIHGSLQHILSNSFPTLFLGLSLFLFYPKIARWVFYSCYFLTGLLVWVFGRNFYHIGASGVIYDLAFFLIFIGVFRKDFKSIVISITVVFLYGGILYGIIPTDRLVSWESHLLGALVGIALAFFYRSK